MRLRDVGIVAALVAAGCVKQAQPVQAPSPWTVAVVAVLEAAESGELQVAPAGLTDALQAETNRRALNAVVPESASWMETFEARRTTEQRVVHVAETANTDLLLVVETEPRWYSQIAGRFRWTVDVDVSFGRSADPNGAVHQHFEVPVTLLFDHQREPEAVAEATSIIDRRVAALLDQWLRAEGGE